MAASRQEYPLSTNVSSPMQAASRRRIAQYRKPDTNPSLHLNGYARDGFVASDDDKNERNESDDESDPAFEDIREAGKPRKSKKRQLGPPITTDEKLERLNHTHRHIVDNFVFEAKRESDKVCAGNRSFHISKCLADHLQILISKNLRAHPFTDTVLREMAINFPKGILIHCITEFRCLQWSR